LSYFVRACFAPLGESLFFRQLLLRCSTSCIHAVVLVHKLQEQFAQCNCPEGVKTMDGLHERKGTKRKDTLLRRVYCALQKISVVPTSHPWLDVTKTDFLSIFP
jgi:hypothetical protein